MPNWCRGGLCLRGQAEEWRRCEGLGKRGGASGGAGVASLRAHSEAARAMLMSMLGPDGLLAWERVFSSEALRVVGSSLGDVYGSCRGLLRQIGRRGSRITSTVHYRCDRLLLRSFFSLSVGVLTREKAARARRMKGLLLCCRYEEPIRKAEQGACDADTLRSACGSSVAKCVPMHLRPPL